MVAGKAALMYAVALLGLRVGQRRTLAQWTITDFITAVAVGAIVGRTAIASTQSFATGGAALLTLIVVHRLVSLLRLHPTLRVLFDHEIRVLIVHGQLRSAQPTLRPHRRRRLLPPARTRRVRCGRRDVPSLRGQRGAHHRPPGRR